MCRSPVCMFGICFLLGVAVMIMVPMRDEAAVTAAGPTAEDDEQMQLGSQQAAALFSLLGSSVESEEGALAPPPQVKQKASKGQGFTCQKRHASAGSRPGEPCLPPAKSDPYSTSTAWREALGLRILRAATPRLSEEACGGVELTPSATLCLAAFRAARRRSGPCPSASRSAICGARR